MKIIDLYTKKTGPIFSFEFFPPKTQEGETKLKSTIGELKSLNPGFVSVTYGAGGSTNDKTIDICAEIQTNFSILSMSHFTCVGASRDEILTTLKHIQSKGIENVIALRGDPPAGTGKFTPHPKGFSNATELVEFIRQNQLPFSIAGGCYPEKHPDSPDFSSDIANLKKKVDAGAQFLITQLFFDNQKYAEFLNKTKSAQISAPIVPGIMPITSFSQIERFKSLANCSIPVELEEKLTEVKENQAEFLNRSLDFTINQCKELLAMGVPGIHFYTLNQSRATREILETLL